MPRTPTQLLAGVRAAQTPRQLRRALDRVRGALTRSPARALAHARGARDAFAVAFVRAEQWRNPALAAYVLEAQALDCARQRATPPLRARAWVLRCARALASNGWQDNAGRRALCRALNALLACRYPSGLPPRWWGWGPAAALALRCCMRSAQQQRRRAGAMWLATCVLERALAMTPRHTVCARVAVATMLVAVGYRRACDAWRIARCAHWAIDWLRPCAPNQWRALAAGIKAALRRNAPPTDIARAVLAQTLSDIALGCPADFAAKVPSYAKLAVRLLCGSPSAVAARALVQPVAARNVCELLCDMRVGAGVVNVFTPDQVEQLLVGLAHVLQHSRQIDLMIGGVVVLGTLRYLAPGLPERCPGLINAAVRYARTRLRQRHTMPRIELTPYTPNEVDGVSPDHVIFQNFVLLMRTHAGERARAVIDAALQEHCARVDDGSDPTDPVAHATLVTAMHEAGRVQGARTECVGMVFYVDPDILNAAVADGTVFLSRPRAPTRNAAACSSRPFLCVRRDASGTWLLPLTSRPHPRRYAICDRRGGVPGATWATDAVYVNDMRTYYVVPDGEFACITATDKYNNNEHLRPFVDAAELCGRIVPEFASYRPRAPPRQQQVCECAAAPSSPTTTSWARIAAAAASR